MTILSNIIWIDQKLDKEKKNKYLND
jgi:hypothetical protein